MFVQEAGVFRGLINANAATKGLLDWNYTTWPEGESDEVTFFLQWSFYQLRLSNSLIESDGVINRYDNADELGSQYRLAR